MFPDFCHCDVIQPIYIMERLDHLPEPMSGWTGIWRIIRGEDMVRKAIAESGRNDAEA